jgi:hypothetical protein
MGEKENVMSSKASALTLQHSRPGGIPRRTFIAAIASAGGILLVPGVALASAETWKGILGAFKWAGGPDEEAARLRAINEVVDRMTPIARGIARSKLREATVIPQKVSLAVDGRLLTVADDQRKDTAPTDGTAVKVTAFNGDEMDLSFRLKEAEIIQSFSDGSKGSVHSFTLDDTKLVVRRAVFASQLPSNIVYKTTYVRS